MAFSIHLRNRQQSILWIILCAVISLFLLSFYHRWVHTDDAWSADQALQMARTGHIRSEIFSGFFRYDYKLLCAHKLHIMQGAWFVNLFGFSPWVLKAVPLPYFLVLIILMLNFQRSFTEYYSTGTLLLSAILFIIHASIFEFSYTYRPELIHACLGFGSFVLIHRAIMKDDLAAAALAGLIAGLAAFVHLNGLTFMAAGGGLLLLYREVKKTVAFSCSSLLTASFYFWDIRTWEDWELFLYQFRNDPALKEQNFSPWNYIEKLTDEHMRLFRDWPQASLTVLLLIVLAVAFTYLKRQHTLLVYTLLLVVSVAVITRDTNSKYYILYIPFFIIIIAQGISHIFSRQSLGRHYACVGLLTFYLIVHLILDIRLIGRRENIVTQNALIGAPIPKGSSVVAPIQFVYNEIDDFDLQALEVYLIQRDKGLLNITFWDYCQQTNKEYVVLNKNGLYTLDLSPEEVRAGNEQFECIAVFPDDYYICRIK